jgi:hypothetical protein
MPLSTLIYYHASGPENGTKEECVSFHVYSDCLGHTATTVHSFLSCIIHHLVSDVLLHVQDVYYFSDEII